MWAGQAAGEQAQVLGAGRAQGGNGVGRGGAGVAGRCGAALVRDAACEPMAAVICMGGAGGTWGAQAGLVAVARSLPLPTPLISSALPHPLLTRPPPAAAPPQDVNKFVWIRNLFTEKPVIEGPQDCAQPTACDAEPVPICPFVQACPADNPLYK